jgi:hypothetical protein
VSKSKKRKNHVPARERRLRVRSERRDPIDVKKLSRALIALAMAQAQAEADAQREHEQTRNAETESPTVADEEAA